MVTLLFDAFNVKFSMTCHLRKPLLLRTDLHSEAYYNNIGYYGHAWHTSEGPVKLMSFQHHCLK